MTPLNHNKISLYQQAKSSLSSLVKQTAQVFVGFVIMLLLTGGSPPGFIVALTVVLGISFVAWSETKSVDKLEKPNTKVSDNETELNKNFIVKIIGDKQAYMEYISCLIHLNKSQNQSILNLLLRQNSYQSLEDSNNFSLKREEFTINEALNELTFEISYGKENNYKSNKNNILKQYNQISFDYIQLEKFLDSNDATKINSNGILLLMNPLNYRQEKMYADVLEKVLEKSKEIDHDQQTHLLALVMNNCESPGIWLARDTPERLIKTRFPSAKRILDIFEREGYGKNIGCFSVSVFGVTGSPPQPNTIRITRKKSIKSIIRDPERWEPFGVLDPIYWFLSNKNQ